MFLPFLSRSGLTRIRSSWVPVPWMPVSPRDFVLRFCLEVGVSDTKVVESTELKQSLTDDFHSLSLLQTGTTRGAMS